MIGVVLGFTTTGLLWAKKQGKFDNINFGTNKQDKQNDNEEIEGGLDATTTPSDTESADEKAIVLEIASPENESISETEKLEIRGKTEPNATVVVVWEEGEDILVADITGQFETEINLVGGENLIEVSSYNDEGGSAKENLTITYTTTKI